jgi:hypothetical protein
MFVLNPNASPSLGGESKLQNLWFFGRLGAYFCLVRGAFLFFASREDAKLAALRQA